MADPPLTAARRAHAHIKRRLLEGAYEDGELLSEGALAAELGMSRTPVREACLQLEAEGLLKLYPKRGALVVAISPREVDELFEARLLVERHTLERCDPAALAEALDPLVARQRAILAGDGDRLAFADADRAFHRTWVQAAGNRMLLGLYDQLRDRQQRVASLLLAGGPETMAEIADEHAAIVAALRAGDRAGAQARLTAHLLTARERSGGQAAGAG